MRGNTKGGGKKCYVDIQTSELPPMLLAGGELETQQSFEKLYSVQPEVPKAGL